MTADPDLGRLGRCRQRRCQGHRGNVRSPAMAAWQYSTDGVTWAGFGSVSASNALLLSSDHAGALRAGRSERRDRHLRLQGLGPDQRQRLDQCDAGLRQPGRRRRQRRPTAAARPRRRSTVTAVNDAPTGLPTISGTATEDQILTADTAAIGDADGLGAFSYQWLRNGVDDRRRHGDDLHPGRGRCRHADQRCG